MKVTFKVSQGHVIDDVTVQHNMFLFRTFQRYFNLSVSIEKYADFNLNTFQNLQMAQNKITL